MKNKKIFKTIGIVLLSILFISISTGIINFFMVKSAQKPIFAIPVTADDGGSGTYYGLAHTIEIKGNFMPEDPIPSIKYVHFSVLGITIEEIFFE